MGNRQLKKEVLGLLTEPDLQKSLSSLTALPLRQVVNPLFSFLYNTDPIIKWHAVSAMGHIVANLADKDMESARVVMRRMIWNLNDESGGIGWGSPEAMGESMACNKRLAGEYNRILVSYIRPDGNFLEHPQLQKGLLWGLARLASVHPEQVKDAGPFLMPFLESQDPDHRGLASLAAGLLQTENTRKALERLCRDSRDFHLYRDYRLESVIVGDMAKRALSGMSK